MSGDVLRVLDLGSGAGGVGTGYFRAGFAVTGIDLVPQPRFPFAFRRGDALAVMEGLLAGRKLAQVSEGADAGHLGLGDFDLIHVSMPCQRWSKQLRCRPELRERYPDLITPLRPLLREAGLPYVMENVEGAPLEAPVTLCGAMFGRELYRHRLLEAGNGLALPQLPHPAHTVRASRAGHWEPGTYVSVAGNCAPMWKVREVMGIDWMRRPELAEAIPPYMTEWAGLHARAQLLAVAA